MKVIKKPCGDFANESERRAFEDLTAKIEKVSGDDTWYFISNLNFTQNDRMLPKELDLVVVSKSGFHVIEIKNWGPRYLERNEVKGNTAAFTLNDKCRIIKNFLNDSLNINLKIYGKFLFTGEEKTSYKSKNQSTFPQISGVKIFGLDDYKYLFNLTSDISILNEDQIQRITDLLMAKQLPKKNTFANYEKIRKISAGENQFRTVYKAKFRENGTSEPKLATLYVFDLTISSLGKEDAELIAKREFKALQAIQNKYVPKILETFQDVPDYPGEIGYFSVFDYNYPNLSVRLKQPWSTKEKIATSIECFKALKMFHEAAEKEDEKVLHRNIKPENILIKEDGWPVFKGFILSRIEGEKTIFPFLNPANFSPDFSAPEILSASEFKETFSEKSDIFSLCKTLMTIFNEADELSKKILTILKMGTQKSSKDRPEVEFFIAKLAEIE